MRYKIAVVFILFIFAGTIYSQQSADAWKKYEYLIGNWVGEGSGQPGEGTGYFSFKPDLDKNILVRISHSEYPAANGRPAVKHDDLMIIYRDFEGNASRAIYFDNENHVINYSISYPNEKEIVFTSDKIPNVPTFRLTYAKIDEVTVNIKFEMSQDGVKFFAYLEGKSKKVNK